MAAKRNKSQAKRNGGGNGAMPAWAWLVLGLALGIGVFLIAPKFIGGEEGFFRPQPNADAQPPALDATDRDEPIVADADAGNPPKATPTPGEEPDYAFYNMLSGEEQPLSDAELAANARAEEERAAKAREAAEKAAADAAKNDDAKNGTATNADDAPKPIDTPIDPPPAVDARPDARDTADTRPQSADNADARYLLQAGAFAASGDAEALKAKIAFLGLSARVESAQIKGNIVYRVRMGPYGSATELADAKRKLAGGGLPAMAIKVK